MIKSFALRNHKSILLEMSFFFIANLQLKTITSARADTLHHALYELVPNESKATLGDFLYKKAKSHIKIDDRWKAEKESAKKFKLISDEDKTKAIIQIMVRPNLPASVSRIAGYLVGDLLIYGFNELYSAIYFVNTNDCLKRSSSKFHSVDTWLAKFNTAWPTYRNSGRTKVFIRVLMKTLTEALLESDVDYDLINTVSEINWKKEINEAVDLSADEVWEYEYQRDKIFEEMTQEQKVDYLAKALIRLPALDAFITARYASKKCYNIIRTARVKCYIGIDEMTDRQLEACLTENCNADWTWYPTIVVHKCKEPDAKRKKSSKKEDKSKRPAKKARTAKK